jgi:hydrogenase small subunit
VETPLAATLGRDEHGRRKPVLDWVIELGEAADVVVAVGTCAAYGGLPAAGRHDSDDGVGSDPTGARGLQFDGRDPGGVFGPAFETGRGLPVVNVPGCPAHPEHVLLTLATLLAGHEPELDEYNRPLPIFGPLVHDDCALREEYEAGNFAQYPGDDGCLYDQGCAGVYSYCDDSVRLRNGGTTICRRVGAPCIGCVEPAFWDRFTPFYEPGEDDGDAGADAPSVGDVQAGDDDPSRMRAVGWLSAGLAGLVCLPLAPVAAGASAVGSLLGDDGYDVSTEWDETASAAGTPAVADGGPCGDCPAAGATDGRDPTRGE